MTVANLGFRCQNCYMDGKEVIDSKVLFYTPHKIEIDMHMGGDGNIHSAEEVKYDHDDWRATGEQDQSISAVKEAPEEGISLSLDYNLSVRGGKFDVPNRKVGFYISRIGNLENDLRRELFDEYGRTNSDTADFIQFLKSKGYNQSIDIEGLSVQDVPVIAFIDLEEKSFGFSKYTYQLTRKIAQIYDIECDEALEIFKKSYIYHEIAHIFGEMSEEKVGKLLAEYFGKRTKETSGRTSSIYRVLQQEEESYAASNKGCKSLSKKGNLEKTIMELFEEAHHEGYRTKEDVMDYVAKRLEESKSEKGKKGSKSKASKYISKDAKDGEGRKQEGDEESESNDGDSSGEEGGE